MIVVFPVAGRGSRFYPESAKVPKCLLPVRSRLMIEWALDSIYCDDAQVIIIYHREQSSLVKPALKELRPGATFVEQTTPLCGPADTVYRAHTLLEHKGDIVVVDCDIYAQSVYQNKDWSAFDGDGSVLTFASHNPSKSYVRIKDEYVVEVAEKNVISDQAIGGIYHFRHGEGFIVALKNILRERQMVHGEFYLSSVLNKYIRVYPRVVAYKARKFYDLGTPEAVEAFEHLNEEDIYG